MTYDEFTDKAYATYEESDCNGNIPIVVHSSASWLAHRPVVDIVFDGTQFVILTGDPE